MLPWSAATRRITARRTRLALKYTLCFCRQGDALLLLRRKKWPHAGQWNGLGGKIEPGERPRDCVVREVREEAGIDLAQARLMRFGGIVTWPPEDDVIGQGSGMLVYVAEFADSALVWPGERSVEDGILRWQPVGWVCDRGNRRVVENIPHFLPPMLAGEPPREYACAYQGDTLLAVTPKALPSLTLE